MANIDCLLNDTLDTFESSLKAQKQILNIFLIYRRLFKSFIFSLCDFHFRSNYLHPLLSFHSYFDYLF